MAFKDIWKDKVDGEDYIEAKDINDIANQVIKNEEDIQEKADKTEIPLKVSQLENDAGYLTEHQDISGKADKPTIKIIDAIALGVDFLLNNNHIIRCGTLHAMGFNFSNGEYPEDYGLDLSFDSGATPTTISYSASGIINWVGVDCTTSDGLSIFQPSPNTHYDIVFYYNGNQFIGLVNGYVPASGNVVSE